MIRYRFKTWSVDDPRPLIDLAQIKMPWWCSGFGTGRHGARPYDDEYAVIVCYLPEGESLYKYWDDAFDVETENVGEIKYSDRFPKPEWCESCKEYDQTTHSCPRWNHVIRETLDDVRKEAMAQRWIPVTERLPERGKDVLVTRNYDGRADHIKSCRYVEVASCYGEDDDVSWNSYSDEYKMTPKNHRVVAWMPLPEPWRGEKDETN